MKLSQEIINLLNEPAMYYGYYNKQYSIIGEQMRLHESAGQDESLRIDLCRAIILRALSYCAIQNMADEIIVKYFGRIENYITLAKNHLITVDELETTITHLEVELVTPYTKAFRDRFEENGMDDADFWMETEPMVDDEADEQTKKMYEDYLQHLAKVFHKDDPQEKNVVTPLESD